MSTDNGGNSDTGGSNHPLRGQKATSSEGGVRGVGWVGGGFASIRRGVISKEMIHVSDWYVRAPTFSLSLSLSLSLVPSLRLVLFFSFFSFLEKVKAKTKTRSVLKLSNLYS